MSRVGFRAPDPVRDKLAAARRDLASALIERDDEVDLALTALVAGEHLLLVGPPGCAKSLLLDSVAKVVDGRRFSILLNKFTTPEEVFGPVSLAGLREDRYRRVTAGRLPEAHLAFLDEVWKASSAVLNTLLRLLNERVYEDDGRVVAAPLRFCVAASNEWPCPEMGKELAALLDRFLFRRTVRPVATAAGKKRLLWEADLTPAPTVSLTPEELDRARADARTLPFADDAVQALEEVLPELAREGVVPGDRRRRKAVLAARAYAYLGGADRVLPEHLEVLASVLWDDPAEGPRVAARVIARVANPAGMRVGQLLLEAEAIVAAADVRDLAQAATAAAKLGEIDKQLAPLAGDPRGAGPRARPDQAGAPRLDRGDLGGTRCPERDDDGGPGRDELLRLLDLEGRHEITENGPGSPADPLAGPPAAGAVPTEGGPTELEVDAWGLRRGRDLLDAAPALRRRGLTEPALADFHAAAFDPQPRLRPDCDDRLRHAFLAGLLETPEYRALHADTRLDEAASAAAAEALALRFADLRDERAREEANKKGEKEADRKARPAAVTAAEIAVLKAVGAALREAAAEVESCHEAAAALGLGPGSPGSVDPKTIAALYRRVRSSPTLKKIVERAGAFRRVAQSARRHRAGHGLDDVVGVAPGGDVGRLLPSELARLALPEAELDTLRRLAERQTLCREHKAVEPVGAGPLIVCVDESGSMAGDKAHSAKALALALAWSAGRQNRWAALVAYSGDTGERVLALPPGRRDEAALLSWLEAFLGGGGDLDVPLRELPRMHAELGAPAGRADAVFVTDALCRVPDEVRADFVAWKARVGLRLIALVVGGAPPGDLAGVADEVYPLPALAADDPAVGRVLSL